MWVVLADQCTTQTCSEQTRHVDLHPRPSPSYRNSTYVEKRQSIIMHPVCKQRSMYCALRATGLYHRPFSQDRAATWADDTREGPAIIAYSALGGNRHRPQRQAVVGAQRHCAAG